MKTTITTLILLLCAALNIVADNPPEPTPPPEYIPIEDKGDGKDNNRSMNVWLPQAIYDAAAKEVIFSCIVDEGETWLLDRSNHEVGYYPGLNGEICTSGLPAGLYTIVFVLNGAQASGTFIIRN